MKNTMTIYFNVLSDGFIADQEKPLENGVNLSGFYSASYSLFIKNDLSVWLENFDEIIIYRKNTRTSIKKEVFQ